ncbi:hypothetical protein KX816_13120 [Sphingosinicellaceae bacterium]|nr:hypothetical protein KX816_13120 [Sphingosinicellaceae bacterium]
MEQTRAARGAVVAGIVTVVISGWFASVAAAACDGVVVSSASALGAFQMAKSQMALDAAIGCPARLDVLNSMNRVDLIAFIASYGLFLVLAALALASGRLRRIALIFIGIALAGDVLETATQLWIGSRWPFTTTPMLTLLAVGSSLKWAGIACGLGATGLSMAEDRLGATRWLGLAVAIFGLLGLMVFVSPTPPPFIPLAFLLLIGACALSWRRGPAQDTPPTAFR